MKIKLLLLSLVILALSGADLKAQNGVRIAAATGTADASAMLDVVSTTKGFLVPRLSLTGPLLTNSAPVTSPADGLLIYNLGLSGVAQKGFYYWNATGATWVIMSAGALSGTGTTNYFPKWTASNTLSGTSLLYDNGTNVGVGTTAPAAKLSVLGQGHISRDNTAQCCAGADAFTLSLAENSSVTARQSAIQFHNSGESEAYFRLSGGGTGTRAGQRRFEIGDNQSVGTGLLISNLAGTGVRPVYATSNGTLTTAFSNATVFSYTGANQTYTVPATGVTSITVKMWGAGGGGGYYGGWNCGFSGGAGGYTQGVIAVTPGQVLTVIVGGGGTGGNVSNTTGSYGGGGAGCPGNSDCRYGAQGGGRSAIRTAAAVELMTAGGGGGGGSSAQAPANTLYEYGGAGGGLVGQDGLMAQYYYGGGQGGSQVIGGYGAKNMSNANGTNGTQYTGGTAGQNSYGGGGGGGWYGGGGGGYMGVGSMGGAGGGSGYIAGAGVSNAFTLRGNYTEPPKVDDPNYAAGIAVGGYSNSTLTPLQGGHGRVVIIPN